MKKIILAGVAVAALAGSTAVYAQHRGWDHGGEGRGFGRHSRMSAEDRLAFLDARIAAVKAGLKLTPDQEKNWPAVETAVRDFARQRIDRANASTDQQQPQEDPVARLRERADRMAATAAGLKKIADAADPLYKTLDEGQKRRLTFLTRMGGHHRSGGWGERFGHGGDRDTDRGGDRDRGDDRDNGPSRL